MKAFESELLGRWGTRLVQQVIHPSVVVGAPGFLLTVLIYLVVTAFYNGANSGIRSFSGTMLPIVLATYLLVFHRETYQKLRTPGHWQRLVIGFAVGVAVMLAFRVLAGTDRSIPVRETLLSACFSALVFTYVAYPDKKVWPYYYGTVCGFLAYVVTFGLPIR